jgi:anti-sigma regulatory factor (Ser/Thr protein kinase)
MMPLPESEAPARSERAERAYPVSRREDALVIGREAQRLGLLFGLAKKRAGELAIVVSELASNIAKYGVRGEIALSFDPDGEGDVRVSARDVGPPFRDLELAKTDGCDDRGPIDPAGIIGRGGLGTGLGAVLRLADQFECRQDEAGKEITVLFHREPVSKRRRT